jgi:hypothetical protein
LTASQLFSTASYQTGDLAGIVLTGYTLNGASFSGANLAGADFQVANLAHANFNHANLTNANLNYTNFADSNLSQANLTYASFENGTATNANFNLANLTNAYLFNANFTNADLSHANLTNNVYYGATLTGANLTGADTRGAQGDLSIAASAIITNLILPDGHIAGLDLGAGQQLIVRDYDGNPNPTLGGSVGPPIAIHVDTHFIAGAGGVLQMVFDADAWGSTISFAPGISVALGGSLELNFAGGMSLAGQVGRTFDLFDWTGVSPTGAFTVSSPYTWDLTNLYTTGEITLLAIPGLPGDFNSDGTVDSADYVVWRHGLGTPYTQNDYNVWRAHFGQSIGSGSGATANAAVPEPAMSTLLMFATAGCCLRPGRAA